MLFQATDLDLDSDFKLTVLVVYAMRGSVFMQLTRDLFAIAKFLLEFKLLLTPTTVAGVKRLAASMCMRVSVCPHGKKLKRLKLQSL